MIPCDNQRRFSEHEGIVHPMPAQTPRTPSANGSFPMLGATACLRVGLWVVLAASTGNCQRATPAAPTIRAIQRGLLVHGLEHYDHRSLQDFVLEAGWGLGRSRISKAESATPMVA